MQTTHHIFMKRALQLAAKGRGFVNPNPMVGAVLVKEGKIIGEGYHTQYGAPHAEIEALRNATVAVEGATLYVSLEPCSHYGKTPPCAEAIVDAKITEVVIAALDPNPLVAGRGVKILQDAGVNVVVGVEEKESRILNRVFFKYILTKHPYVLLKTAMTLDGKIATQIGDSRWVSGEVSRQRVHELRHSLMGIMVGVNTVIKDDPQLDCRLDGRVKQPIKIVTDSLLRTPLKAKLWQKGEFVIATTTQADESLKEKFIAKGARIIVAGEQRVDLQLLMCKLGEMGIDSVLLEGGAMLNASALQQGIVDEIWTFIAPKIIGGALAPTPIGGEGALLMKDAHQLQNVEMEPSGEDWLFKGILKKN